MQIARARHRIAAYLFDCAIVYSISILILARPLVLLIKTLNSTTSIDVINLFINSIVSGGIVLIFIIFYCVIKSYVNDCNNFKGEYCNHCKSKSDCRNLTIEEQRKYFEEHQDEFAERIRRYNSGIANVR